MLGYYDPDSLTVGETEGVISFINAADSSMVRKVRIETPKDAKAVLDALSDQIQQGLAGSEGRFKRVQGVFTRTPGRLDEGLVQTGNRNVPIKLDFNLQKDELPQRALCIAVGEMVDGALMVERITLAPIAPMPTPSNGVEKIGTPNS